MVLLVVSDSDSPNCATLTCVAAGSLPGADRIEVVSANRRRVVVDHDVQLKRCLGSCANWMRCGESVFRWEQGGRIEVASGDSA